jgi:hypothetical protein
MVFDIRGELQGGRNRRTDGFLRGSQDLPHHHRSSDDLGGHGPRLRHDGESLREGMQPSVEYGGDEIMRHADPADERVLDRAGFARSIAAKRLPGGPEVP